MCKSRWNFGCCDWELFAKMCLLCGENLSSTNILSGTRSFAIGKKKLCHAAKTSEDGGEISPEQSTCLPPN